MPESQTWENRKELVSALQGCWKDHLKGQVEWECLIYSAIGGNTFRAFRGVREPAKIFRKWAKAKLVDRKYFDRLHQVTEQKHYDRWLDGLVISFMRFWERKTKKKDTPLGTFYKLLNLLMKSAYSKLKPKYRKRILPLLHVPLDSYTLRGIRSCLDLPNGKKIPKKVSMRFVKDKRTYNAVQKGIRDLAKEAKVPPIAYEYLAWNSAHH